jgi:hypothetical protein
MTNRVSWTARVTLYLIEVIWKKSGVWSETGPPFAILYKTWPGPPARCLPLAHRWSKTAIMIVHKILRDQGNKTIPVIRVSQAHFLDSPADFVVTFFRFIKHVNAVWETTAIKEHNCSHRKSEFLIGLTWNPGESRLDPRNVSSFVRKLLIFTANIHLFYWLVQLGSCSSQNPTSKYRKKILCNNLINIFNYINTTQWVISPSVQLGGPTMTLVFVGVVKTKTNIVFWWISACIIYLVFIPPAA